VEQMDIGEASGDREFSTNTQWVLGVVSGGVGKFSGDPVR